MAQACHGVSVFCLEHLETSKDWFEISNYICILAAKSENHLLELYNKAQKKCVRVSVFREPDINNEVTCIVLEPSLVSKKICSNLRLALSS